MDSSAIFAPVKRVWKTATRVERKWIVVQAWIGALHSQWNLKRLPKLSHLSEAVKPKPTAMPSRHS